MFKSENISASIGTALYLLLLFLLLIFISLKVERMKPEPVGIEMSFGTVADAGGDAYNPSSASAPPTASNEIPAEVMTSEASDAEVVTNHVVKTQPNNTPTTQTTNTTTQTQTQRNEFDDLYNDAVTNSKTGAGKGSTQGKGDQGNPNGTTDGDGTGTGGKGYTNGNPLGDGDAVSKPPKPVVNSNQGGRVVVKACIDKLGNVSRIVDDRFTGTTAVEANLFTEARSHVLKMKFAADSKAPTCRVAIIPIVFKPGSAN